jgi:hypothetical protein
MTAGAAVLGVARQVGARPGPAARRGAAGAAAARAGRHRGRRSRRRAAAVRRRRRRGARRRARARAIVAARREGPASLWLARAARREQRRRQPPGQRRTERREASRESVAWSASGASRQSLTVSVELVRRPYERTATTVARGSKTGSRTTSERLDGTVRRELDARDGTRPRDQWRWAVRRRRPNPAAPATARPSVAAQPAVPGASPAVRQLHPVA